MRGSDDRRPDTRTAPLVLTVYMEDKMTYVYVTRPDKKGERHIIKQPKPLPMVTQKLLGLTNVPQKRKANA